MAIDNISEWSYSCAIADQFGGPLPSEGAEKALRTGVAKVLEASRASAPDKMVD